MEELREISVHELASWMKTGKPFTILDVREEWELNYAKLLDKRVLNLPMSRIGRELKEAYPADLRNPNAEIVVMCHRGVRSANVAIWMTQNGWKNISSLAGGIGAYADEIDSSVGKY